MSLWVQVLSPCFAIIIMVPGILWSWKGWVWPVRCIYAYVAPFCSLDAPLTLVSRVEFSKKLFEADEIDGQVEICLTKDLDTASGFVVTLTAQETTPNPPETFRARGVCWSLAL